MTEQSERDADETSEVFISRVAQNDNDALRLLYERHDEDLSSLVRRVLARRAK